MNILISGVGGQGALLASRVFINLAKKIKQDIKISEIHGMSQRGGSVVTHVRIADKVYSPVSEKGAVDFIMAFEQLEGARYVEWLREGGTLILNNQKMDPMPVASGKLKYPEDLIEEISQLPLKLYSLDGVEMARQAGNIRTVNIVLVGVLASLTDIPKALWEESIRETVPERFLEENLRAFQMGYEFNQI